MKLGTLFKTRSIPVDEQLRNELVKKLIDDFTKGDMTQATALVLIYEIDGIKKETFWKCAGMEPAQAILSMDQLHHRIQHEGLDNYD